MGQFSGRVLILLAGDGQVFDFDLRGQGRRLAELKNLSLDGSNGAPSRLLISLTAHADSGARIPDGTAGHQQVSGTCSQCLCWTADEPPRQVRSRLRRRARRIDWRLSIHPLHIKGLSISVRVDDVERLPDSLEAAFGVPSRGS